MKKSDIVKPSGYTSKPKRAYIAPLLITYGPLRQITQGGMMGGTEGAGGGPMTRA
jgi:hypothetical protein